MCSDGLSGLVSDEEMGAIATALPPEEACRLLVHLANLRGGPDNITVMIVRVSQARERREEGVRDESPIGRGQSVTTRIWQLVTTRWTYILLIVGLLLAAVAVNLASDAISRSASGKMAASVVVFLMAIAALLAGSLGLAWHYYRHHLKSENPKFEKGLHVYHEADCQVNRPLLERLKEAEKTLAQQIRDNNWEVDWETNQKHRELAEKASQEKDLPVAFREYCWALLPLTDTLELYRSKEEIFQPLWDKRRVSGE
jgi:protein phosphatase